MGDATMRHHRACNSCLRVIHTAAHRRLPSASQNYQALVIHPPNMRKAQSAKHFVRPSLALGTDDLGVLTEGDENLEDALRRQLLDKDRENDHLKSQVQALHDQLATRPSLEQVQQLEREYKNLEILLQGTNRENERAMIELERSKAREKMLERELAKLAGENWQTTLDIAPSPAPSVPRGIGSSMFRPSPPPTGAASNQTASSGATVDETRAHIEQVRLLVLGMEQRLQTREDKLTKIIQRAESESKKCEDVHREVANISV